MPPPTRPRSFNDYDQAVRRLLKRDPAGLLGWLLPGLARLYRFAHWLDSRSAADAEGRLPDRIADSVAELFDLLQAGPPWMLLTEVQQKPDPDMFGRLLVYLGLLWLALRPDPLRASRYQLAALVLNLTGTTASLPAGAEFVFLPEPDVRLVLRPREVHLAVLSAEQTLQQIEAGAVTPWGLALVPLMTAQDIGQVTRTWVALAEKETDNNKRAEYGNLAWTFADLREEHMNTWHEALEKWEDVRSPFLESIRKEARDEGLKEGVKEGLLRGLELALEVKFGVEGATLLPVLRQQTDLAVLEKIAQAIKSASTLDDLRRLLP